MSRSILHLQSSQKWEINQLQKYGCTVARDLRGLADLEGLSLILNPFFFVFLQYSTTPIPTMPPLALVGNFAYFFLGDMTITTKKKTSSGAERKYVYGPTGLLAVIENGSAYYLFKDHLKSTHAAMNGTTGAGVAYNAYNAWGELMASQTSPDVRYKYTGQEYACPARFLCGNAQTGIYNYRALMYDEELGRFYAIDPVENSLWRAGVGFSPYNYAANNPVSFTDPSGRGPVWYNDYMEAKEEAEQEEFEMRLARQNADQWRMLGNGEPFAGDEFFLDASDVIENEHIWARRREILNFIFSNEILRKNWSEKLDFPEKGEEFNILQFPYLIDVADKHNVRMLNDVRFDDKQLYYFNEVARGVTGINPDFGKVEGPGIPDTITLISPALWENGNQADLVLTLDHELYHVNDIVNNNVTSVNEYNAWNHSVETITDNAFFIMQYYDYFKLKKEYEDIRDRYR
ncbi:MAG: RHS repeat-associated core domain-containing protein [Bacteroidetes bacterium]|nr:MAG: RHS repeat-associated core domain-containing protein [Bacteroidota bacterium]